MKKYKYTARECLNEWLDSSCDYSKLSTMLNEKVEDKRLKRGDKYWFIDEIGIVDYEYWSNTYNDRFRLKAHDVFRTREEAEKRLKEIMEEK